MKWYLYKGKTCAPEGWMLRFTLFLAVETSEAPSPKQNRKRIKKDIEHSIVAQTEDQYT